MSFDELPRSILTRLPLEDVLLETTAVSLGLLLDEAWNTKPAALNEPVGQGTGAPSVTLIMLVDELEDASHGRSFLVTKVRLAVRTEAALTSIASQMGSSDAFDGEVA
jgi:hypothetical protein